MALLRGIQEYIALDASTRAILLASRAIYSCIPLKAIKYCIIIFDPHKMKLSHDLFFKMKGLQKQKQKSEAQMLRNGLGSGWKTYRIEMASEEIERNKRRVRVLSICNSI